MAPGRYDTGTLTGLIIHYRRVQNTLSKIIMVGKKKLLICTLRKSSLVTTLLHVSTEFVNLLLQYFMIFGEVNLVNILTRGNNTKNVS